MLYPDLLTREGVLMALLLLQQGLNVKDMVAEVPSLKYFALALNDWASQQDKQITTGQMVLLFFFLTLSDFHRLITLVKVTAASCYLKPLWWCFPAYIVALKVMLVHLYIPVGAYYSIHSVDCQPVHAGQHQKSARCSICPRHC